MPTNASGGFITALEASLANGAHGWAVTGVTERSETRLSAVSVTGSTTGSVTGSTSGTITGGEGSVTGSVTGSTTGSTSSTNTSITVDVLTVSLEAANLRLPGSAAPMRLTYVSTKVDTVFTSAVIRQAGAELTSTDASLEATMRGLAAAFQTAQDAALTTALGGPVAVTPTAPATASGALIAALKASLADPAAAWSVIGGTTTTSKEPAQEPGGALEMVVARIDHIVALSSPLVRVAVGARPPLSISYIGSTDAEGTYLESRLYVDGRLFMATDEDLHDQILALAVDAAPDIDAEVTASLVLGPQTEEDLAA